MDEGIFQVLAKDVVTSEMPIAWVTVVVPWRLAIMLCQIVFIGEILATVFTIVVLSAVGPMLLQPILGKELPIITALADVVLWRFLPMHLEGVLVNKVTIATIAARHGSATRLFSV